MSVILVEIVGSTYVLCWTLFRSVTGKRTIPSHRKHDSKASQLVEPEPQRHAGLDIRDVEEEASVG